MLSALASGNVNDVNKLSTNTLAYDKVASRLSDELLAALAWSAHTSTPSGQNNVATVNISSTSASPSHRSWELFLAQIVSNLSLEAKAFRGTTPSVKIIPATLTQERSSHVIDKTSAPSVGSTSNDVDRQQQQQQQQLSASRTYHRHHHALHTGLGLHMRPGIPRTPLNLKSPPAARLNRLEVSTDEPGSRQWKTTTRLPLLTTPPAYVRHFEHIHHRHHHHERVIVTPASASSQRHNSTHNITDTLWSKPASQLSAVSLFRILGLWTGNDVNVTSSSVTIADMMRYVLRQATRSLSSGASGMMSSYLLIQSQFLSAWE